MSATTEDKKYVPGKLVMRYPVIVIHDSSVVSFTPVATEPQLALIIRGQEKLVASTSWRYKDGL